jgi:hypothetical protein
MGLIGPNLNLIPHVGVGADQRGEWREYLRRLQGEGGKEGEK